MHYTGTIWRPPYEADSLLLEVTAGCTHHKCKFCTLYSDLPFKFRMSPIEDIENDLLEAQVLRTNPYSKMLIRLQGKDDPDPIRRVFLTGANPFVLKTEKLLEIASLIHKYFPSVNSIGCFARITDSANKTDDELICLHRAGYNGLTIGVETADDKALAFMRKGYNSKDILTQCKRLEQADIEYGFFYLTGISGKGKGEAGAKASARVFNQLHPFLIGPNMLTIYPESDLYQEIQNVNWEEESEIEKYQELRMPFNSEDDCQRIKNSYWKHLTESFVRSVKKSFVITEETSRICNRPYLRDYMHTPCSIIKILQGGFSI